MNTTQKTLTESIDCKVIRISTTNLAEANPQTAKIGAIWQTFYQDYFAKLPQDSDIYSIYCNYESDANSAFNVISGFKQNDSSTINSEKITQVAIHHGNYLVFREQGAMPDVVTSTWEKVWDYFNGSNCKHTRLYDVDFEHYVGESRVDVYIGIEA